jgi:hypothetical protein
MLIVAAAVLSLEMLAWLRDGAWQPISLDAMLRHWGVAITEIEMPETPWVDRIDETILSLPLTLALVASATSALALAWRMKVGVTPE